MTDIQHPRGAILTEADLQKLIEQGKPFWQVTCGEVNTIVTERTWAIEASVFAPHHRFLYRKKGDGKTHQMSVFALGDYHIDSHGHNDNYVFFDALDANEYAASPRSRKANQLMKNYPILPDFG